MTEEATNLSVEFWVRTIEQKGPEAVTAALASKIGTPESKVIQLAMVEYYKKQEANDLRIKTTSGELAANTNPEALKISKIALKIACAALVISVISLVLVVVRVFN